jgi:hypothetical protein
VLVVVVPERVNYFPFDVLAGGLDWSDGRGCEDAGELPGERVTCGQEPAISDDLLRMIRRLLKAARSDAN